MGNSIIKPNRDEDFYVVWSSISESPVAFGTREEVKADLIADAIERATEETEKRLARTDERGTSSHIAGDDDVFIYEQKGMLRKDQLKELCLRLAKDENADVSDMLEPFDDADD